MVIEEELSFQQNRITQLKLYYEILCIKIYYEKHRVRENDYLSNENDLSVFTTQTKLNKIEETKIGKAAFFDPLTSIEPKSSDLPVIIILSIL